MFPTFFLSLNYCSRPTAQRDGANGHAKRNGPRTNSTKYIQCLQAFLPFFVGNENRSSGAEEKKSQDMFRGKKVTRGISWIECSLFLSFFLRSDTFSAFLSPATLNRIVLKSQPLKYHFRLSEQDDFFLCCCSCRYTHSDSVHGRSWKGM